MLHKISISFKLRLPFLVVSHEFPGQSTKLILFLIKEVMIKFELLHGSNTFRNVPSKVYTNGITILCNISMYLDEASSAIFCEKTLNIPLYMLFYSYLFMPRTQGFTVASYYDCYCVTLTK